MQKSRPTSRVRSAASVKKAHDSVYQNDMSGEEYFRFITENPFVVSSEQDFRDEQDEYRELLKSYQETVPLQRRSLNSARSKMLSLQDRVSQKSRPSQSASSIRTVGSAKGQKMPAKPSYEALKRELYVPTTSNKFAALNDTDRRFLEGLPRQVGAKEPVYKILEKQKEIFRVQLSLQDKKREQERLQQMIDRKENNIKAQEKKFDIDLKRFEANVKQADRDNIRNVMLQEIAVRNRLGTKQKVEQIASEQLKLIGIVEKLKARQNALLGHRNFLFKLANKEAQLNEDNKYQQALMENLRLYIQQHNTVHGFCTDCLVNMSLNIQTLNQNNTENAPHQNEPATMKKTDKSPTMTLSTPKQFTQTNKSLNSSGKTTTRLDTTENQSDVQQMQKSIPPCPEFSGHVGRIDLTANGVDPQVKQYFQALQTADIDSVEINIAAEVAAGFLCRVKYELPFTDVSELEEQFKLRDMQRDKLQEAVQEAELLLERGKQAFRDVEKGHIQKITQEETKLQGKQAAVARLKNRASGTSAIEKDSDTGLITEYQRRLSKVSDRVTKTYFKCFGLKSQAQAAELSQMAMLSQIEQRLEQLGTYCAAYQQEIQRLPKNAQTIQNTQLRKEEEYERLRLKRKGEKATAAAKARQAERNAKYLAKAREPVKKRETRPIYQPVPPFPKRTVGAQATDMQQEDFKDRDFYGEIEQDINVEDWEDFED